MSDWVPPDWRHNLINTLLAAAVLAACSLIGLFAMWCFQQMPRMSFTTAVVLCFPIGGTLAGLAGGIYWRYSTISKEEPQAAAAVVSAQPIETPNVRMKYSANQTLQYPDMTVIEDATFFPTDLQSSLNLGGVASLKVLVGFRGGVSLARNPIYSEPRPASQDGNTQIVGAVVSQEYDPEIKFDLGKNQVKTIEAEGRTFVVTLFSIEPKPYGENAGIIEYNFGVNEK